MALRSYGTARGSGLRCGRRGSVPPCWPRTSGRPPRASGTPPPAPDASVHVPACAINCCMHAAVCAMRGLCARTCACMRAFAKHRTSCRLGARAHLVGRESVERHGILVMAYLLWTWWAERASNAMPAPHSSHIIGLFGHFCSMCPDICVHAGVHTRSCVRACAPFLRVRACACARVRAGAPLIV